MPDLAEWYTWLILFLIFGVPLLQWLGRILARVMRQAHRLEASLRERRSREVAEWRELDIESERPQTLLERRAGEPGAESRRATAVVDERSAPAAGEFGTPKEQLARELATLFREMTGQEPAVAPRPLPAPRRTEKRPPSPTATPTVRRSLVSAAPAETAPRDARGTSGRAPAPRTPPLDRTDLRRAIIWSEVLAPPLALRSP